MRSNYQHQLESLFEEAKSSILAVAESKKNGYIHFRSPINLCYKSSDGGYVSDDLARVTSDEDALFVYEGETCPSSYDFDEDDKGITSDRMFLDDLTYESMFIVADKVLKTKRFTKKFKEILSHVILTIVSIEGKVEIEPTVIETDYDCSWCYQTVTHLSKDGFYDENDRFWQYDYDNERGSSIDDYELSRLADAFLSKI